MNIGNIAQLPLKYAKQVQSGTVSNNNKMFSEKGDVFVKSNKSHANIATPPVFSGSFYNTDATFSKNDILKILSESKDLTLSSTNLLKKYYSKNDIYDFPLKFATACYNSRDLGNQYITDKIPEIFKGISEYELCDAFDSLSSKLRDESLFESDFPSVVKKIGNKNFFIDYLGEGGECKVFTISDSLQNNDNSVIFKIYDKSSPICNFDNFNVSNYGFYGNIGLLREANRAGVCDVPDLYLANPIFSDTDIDENLNSKGGWAVVENANTKDAKDGLGLKYWLRDMGLDIYDYCVDNLINGFYIDLGGIDSRACGGLYDNKLPAYKLISEIYSEYLSGKTTEDIINELS